MEAPRQLDSGLLWGHNLHSRRPASTLPPGTGLGSFRKPSLLAKHSMGAFTSRMGLWGILYSIHVVGTLSEIHAIAW